MARVLSVLMQAVLASLVLWSPLLGMPRDQSRAGVADSLRIRVAVLSVAPGTLLWERFGHSAIWIREERTGLSRVYNWGVFDFEAPGFIWRFITGDTRYMFAAEPLDAFVAAHSARGRAIAVQELELSDVEIQAVLDFVAWNGLPENRYYQYDYFLDNCSTRVRDVVDRVTHGALRRGTLTDLSGESYRSETRRMLSGSVAVEYGVQLALGAPADRELSEWDDMFLPLRVRQRLSETVRQSATGGREPLVRREYVLGGSASAFAAPALRRFRLVSAALGCVIAGLLILLVSLAGRIGTRSGAAAVSGVLITWAVAFGLIGSIIGIVGLATRHAFWQWNASLAVFNPLALLIAVLVICCVPSRSRHLGQVTRWMDYSAVVVAVLGALSSIAPSGTCQDFCV